MAVECLGCRGRRLVAVLAAAAATCLAAQPASAQDRAAPTPALAAPDCSGKDVGDRPECAEARPGIVLLPGILLDLFPFGNGAPPAGAATDPAAQLLPPAAPAAAAPPPAAQVPASPPPASPSPAPASRQPAVPPRAIVGDFVPDEVLVTVEGDAAVVQDLAAAYGLDVRSQRLSALLGATVVRFGIPDGRPVGLVLAQLSGDGRMRDREPNSVFMLQQAGRVANYAFQRIALDAGSASGEDVRVAVIDTAVDETHPELEGAVAAMFDALPGIPVATRDHGTSVAGLIAGAGGMAPGASIYHARAFEDGKSTMDAILSAVDWAAAQDVRIVNMSFVGPKNELLRTACAAARAQGIVMVAAAGNNGPDAPYGYPAAFDGVIAVTATDAADRLMPQANRGAYVFVAAPGVDVVAPVGGGSDLVTGTSFAAAVASGAIANLIGAAPDRTAAWVEAALSGSATDLGEAGRDIDFGYGLLNWAAAQKMQKLP